MLSRQREQEYANPNVNIPIVQLNIMYHLGSDGFKGNPPISPKEVLSCPHNRKITIIEQCVIKMGSHSNKNKQ